MAVHHKVQSTTNVSNSATCVLKSNEINSVYWRDSCILCSLQPRYRVSLCYQEIMKKICYTHKYVAEYYLTLKRNLVFYNMDEMKDTPRTLKELPFHSVIYRCVLPIIVEYHVHDGLYCPWKGAVTIWNIPVPCSLSSPGVTFVLCRKHFFFLCLLFLQDRDFGISSSCSGAHTCMEMHMYFCWINFYWCCRLNKWAATLLHFTQEAGFLHSF